MSSLSVPAVPGLSVVISSKDTSFDVRKLKFNIDRTGQASSSSTRQHGVYGGELSLNISCESFSSQGLPCLRISIEGETIEAPSQTEPLPEAESPPNPLNHPGPSATGHQQWNCFPSNMTININPQSMTPTFVTRTNAISDLQMGDSTSFSSPDMRHSDASMGMPNLFDFDWGHMDFSNGDPSAKESMMSLLVSDPGQGMEDPRLGFNEMSAHAGMSTINMEAHTPNTQPSPPESSVCSELTSNDGTYSESETDAEDDEELMRGDDQEPRRLACRHEGCKIQFKSNYTRKLHEKSHSAKTPRVFVCSYPSCNVKISRRHDLLRHEVRKHGKKSEWQCQFCQTFFSSEKTQERHTCSKKTIQTSSSAGTTTCWKLPRQPSETQ